MKKLNEAKYNPELTAKIEACKTTEELLKVAAENNIELSLDEAKKYFEKGSVKLSNEDLDKVAGGLVGRPMSGK